MVFLSCDPGISNFAYTVFKISYPDKNLPILERVLQIYDSLEILDYSFIQTPITELKYPNIIPRVDSFIQDNLQLRNYEPDYIVLERFQARGITRGPANEIINYHIALVLSLFSSEQGKDTSIKAGRLLIPAQWKRYYTISKGDSFLETKYGELKLQDKLYKKKVKIHHLDSLFMGLFFYLDLYVEDKDTVEFKQELFKHNFFEKFSI